MNHRVARILVWTLAMFLCFIIVTGVALGVAYVAVWALKAITENPEKSLRLDLELMRKYKRHDLELYTTRNTDRLILVLRGDSDVQDLTLTRTDVTADGISYLSEIPHLRRLELYAGANIDDAALAQLSRLPVLEELVLRNCPITNSGLVTLKKLDHLRRLTIYQDDPRWLGLSDGAVDSLEGLTNLTEIHLVGGWLSDQGFQRLKKSRPDCLVTTSERHRWR